MQRADLISTRNYRPADENFIMCTFLRGLYHGCAFFKDMPKDLFMARYREYLTKLMASPHVAIKIACLKEDEDVMLGYSITRTVDSKNVCDFVFVKNAWRGIGIAKSLVPSPLHVVTHLTKSGRRVKPPQTVFDPFI